MLPCTKFENHYDQVEDSIEFAFRPFFQSARHAASSSISFQPSRGNPRQVRDLSEVRPDPPWRSELVFRPHDFAGSAAVPRNGADEAANLFAPTSFGSMCHDPTSWVNKYTACTTYLFRWGGAFDHL